MKKIVSTAALLITVMAAAQQKKQADTLSEKEIKEVELLLKLRPQDKEILYRLGSLYFSQGLNAKGLQIYEELKRTNYKKAEDLISSYGSFIVV